MTFTVVTGQFMHETNTFSVQPCDVEAFAKRFRFEGAEGLERARDANLETGGFMEVAAAEGWKLVPTVIASANPCGKVTDAAWEANAGRIVEGVRACPRVDGVLLGLHGAMVSESHDDAEGALVAEIRRIVGPDVPIAVTLDLHANVSDEMARDANILVSYKTYPHVDMRARGVDAARLLGRAMRGEIRPRVAIARRPLLSGVDGGRSDKGPMVAIHAAARRYEGEPGVLDVSVNAGFSAADIAFVGPTVTVTGDGDDPRFRAIAESLMDELWAARNTVTNVFLTPAEAAARAKAYRGTKPLVIADFADNPGSGAYGDATALLRALIDAGVENAAFGSIRDAEAAAALIEAGVGADVTIDVGGKVDPRFGGPPLRLTGTVVHAGSGAFTYAGPMLAGIPSTLGPCAVLRTGGIDVLVATNLMQLLDLNMFRANGIEPTEKSVVVVKSKQHFRAAFEPIAGEVIVADSGALASPDLSRMPYVKARRPIHPLDPDAAWPERDGASR